MQHAIDTADTLSKYNMGALFLLSIGLLLFAGFYAVKYLIARSEKLTDALTVIIEKQNATNEKLIVCVNTNTIQTDHNTQFLARTDQTLKDVAVELTKCRESRYQTKHNQQSA